MSMYHIGEGDLHLSDEQIEDFEIAFGLFDREGTGSITIHDLRAVLRSLGKNPTDDELQDMIREVDDDESGTIEFPEFLTMMVRKVKAPESEQELINAFRVFDLEGNGFISSHYLRHVLSSMGEKLNETDMNEFIKAADIHKDGGINYVEFVRLMAK